MVQLFETITPNQKLTILAHFGKTSETSRNDVIALKDWCLKQPHLPEVPCKYRNFLTIFDLIF